MCDHVLASERIDWVAHLEKLRVVGVISDPVCDVVHIKHTFPVQPHLLPDREDPDSIEAESGTEQDVESQY